MKRALLIFVLLIVATTAFSQGSYTSQNNKTANWETSSIWTKQYSWMAAAPPGPADVSGSYVVNIYGYVTRNGNLSITGGSTLNVYDTLIIKGNFTVASSVVVHPGGVLIITGDFTSTTSGGNKLVNNGNVVTAGNFSHSGGNITTNNKFYSFDTTPTFSWGANVDGVNYNGSNTSSMGNELRSHANLNSTNPGLSNFVNKVMGVMPVKLISFEGYAEDQSIFISWTTSKEEGFDHFEIERASSDLIFSKIGEVKGAGFNTSDEQLYSMTDTKPVLGENYYRLKAVDIDGSFEYFNVIIVSVSAPKSISVYPNPSTGDFVNVLSNFELSNNARVQIFNNEGVLIQDIQVTTQEFRIDFTNQLAQGVYILRFKSGEFTQTARFSVK